MYDGLNLFGTVSVDAAQTLAGHLSREWGDYGYSLRIGGMGGGWAVAECAHFDGSRWVMVTDRYGSFVGVGDDVTAACQDYVNRQVRQGLRRLARGVNGELELPQAF